MEFVLSALLPGFYPILTHTHTNFSFPSCSVLLGLEWWFDLISLNESYVVCQMFISLSNLQIFFRMKWAAVTSVLMISDLGEKSRESNRNLCSTNGEVASPGCAFILWTWSLFTFGVNVDELITSGQLGVFSTCISMCLEWPRSICKLTHTLPRLCDTILFDTWELVFTVNNPVVFFLILSWNVFS